MNDEPCTVEINGYKYYGPCDLIDTIVVWKNPNNNDKYLISTGNENFSIVRNIYSLTNQYGGYPRISFYPNRFAAYYADSTVNTPTDLKVTSFSVTHRNTPTSILLMVVIIGVLFLRLFKR